MMIYWVVVRAARQSQLIKMPKSKGRKPKTKKVQAAPPKMAEQKSATSTSASKD
jgi:hypothetical protein